MIEYVKQDKQSQARQFGSIIENKRMPQVQNSGAFVTGSSFYGFILVHIIVISVLLMLWKRIWQSTHQLYVNDAPFIQQELKVHSPNTDSSRVYILGCTHAFWLLRRIITQFNHDYICQNVGFQAFTYLAFLGRIVKIMAVLCIMDVCIWIPYLVFFEQPDNFSLITMQSVGNANFRTTYSVVVSAVILYFMYTLKRLLRYRLRYNMVSDVSQPPKKDLTGSGRKHGSPMLNWLTLRTVNLQILSNHNSPEAPFKIKEFLQKYLNIQEQNRSMIADIVPIPDYGNLLNKHYELEYYRIVRRMAEQQRIPCLWNYFTYNSVESVEAKILQLQTTIEDQTLKGTQSALGAFMVLDSMQGVRILCENFSGGRMMMCKDRLNDLFVQQQMDYVFSIKTSQCAQDIVWSNMQYTKSGRLRQIIINVLCISILVFISTPSTVLNPIKLKTSFITLIVLVTNSLLSMLLSVMVRQQKNIFQSKKQMKEYVILVFYLSMNMILVPIVRGVKNVIELFVMSGGWRWVEVFELVYKKVDGYFFCLLFLNQMTSSFFDTLIKPAELIQNFCSGSLYLYKTKIHKYNSSYGRNDNFMFGTNYALIMTLLTIAILFSCSIPLIHFFALLFFLSRYYLDTYTLLTFHRQQCQTLGVFISKILFSVAVAVSMQLFLVANSLLIENMYINAIVLYSVFAIAIYVATHLLKPLVNDIDIVTDPELHDIKIKKYHLDEWRNSYTHPLMKRL